MHNFEANYAKILEILKSLHLPSNYFDQIRKPKLKDIELVAIDLTSEYMSIDSECQLFRILPRSLFNKIERSVYNRRKRKLFPFRESIRKELASRLNNTSSHFVVDSMPLEVCKLSRSTRSKVCTEEEFSRPVRGYCASQSTHYYGYKLHAVCSLQGVFQSLDISPANVHDINYLKDIQNQLKDCVLLGDRGYLSAKIQLDLFQSHNIKLETPMRRNQHNFKEQPYIFKKSRKRIETLFSQLCDQFMIRRNYAKSFDGFKNRILSKITALTVIQYINKFQFGRNINNLKTNIT